MQAAGEDRVAAGEPLVLWHCPVPGVARLTLNRPAQRNAQSSALLLALDQALERAMADTAVRVVILAAAGPHFSAGHDLRERFGATRTTAGISNWTEFDAPGAQGRYEWEQEVYLQLTRRWRNCPKPTIAQVHGQCIAGGLMLAWACDLIIAAEDARFCDPVVAMGVLGVEWFAHPWELGPRKAKELLFTADAWSAQEAHRLGMCNHVVPAAELAGFTLALAQRIAAKPMFALKLAKEAVNRSLDIMGQASAIDQAFALHQVCHAHNQLRFGLPVDPAGLPAGFSLTPQNLSTES
jgi:enoyl-CoA hydratase